VKAFTLIEAMACLLIVALAMTIATVNLRAGRRDAGLEAAVVELQQQDRLMRDRSQRQLSPGELAFDLADGSATRSELSEKTTRRTRLESLGATVKVKAVRSASGEVYDNVFTIRCRGGRTPSYAVLLAAGEKQQWLVVCGLTGAIEKVDDERKVSDIFAKLASDSDDPR
jgi:type II secretory pathway pseudopilin PulG